MKDLHAFLLMMQTKEGVSLKDDVLYIYIAICSSTNSQEKKRRTRGYNKQSED